LLIFSCKRR